MNDKTKEFVQGMIKNYESNLDAKKVSYRHYENVSTTWQKLMAGWEWIVLNKIRTDVDDDRRMYTNVVQSRQIWADNCTILKYSTRTSEKKRIDVIEWTLRINTKLWQDANESDSTVDHIIIN